MNTIYKEPTLSGDFLEGEGVYFRTQINTIKDSITDELFNKFCSLNADRNRILFVYNLDILHKIELPVAPHQKDAEKALKLKNQGNVSFGKQNYVHSVRLYGYALIQCPIEEGVLLATLYANRSAAFYYLQEYKYALQDINLTLSLPYPENLEHKIRERQAKCYLAVNDLKNALQAFKIAITSIEKSNLIQKERQKKEHDFTLMIVMLNKSLSTTTLSTKKPLTVKTVLPNVPHLSGERNEIIPAASDSLTIQESEKEGRFAIAKKNIDAGEVLVVENAHCANLLMEYSKTHCQHCFLRVIYLVPCPHCSNIVFCSSKCRNIALDTYHKYECKFLGSLWISGSSLICSLAVRIITQRGLLYFKNIQSQLNNVYERTKGEQYDGTSYKTVYELCRHENQRSQLDFFQRSVMAVILLKFLQISNFFDKSNTHQLLSEDEAYIGELLLHNLQVLQFNAHEIAELQFNPDFLGDLERAKSQFIGGGLFPTLALFNHSCEPGIVRYFSGSKVIVRSVKPIYAGEIIAENYGPIYTEVTKLNRKQELQMRYWFDCNCLPCTNNWPLFDEMKTDILPFRCTKSRNCTGVVFVSVDTEEFMFPCPECKEMILIFGCLKGLNETEIMFKKGENFMKNHLFKDALDVFLKIIKLLDNTLKPPFKDFCLCQQKIRSCMLTFGNNYIPNIGNETCGQLIQK